MIEIGNGIQVGGGIIIGQVNAIFVIVDFITEDNNNLISETGDQFIEET
jgi:hypothetical protein